MKEEIRLRLSDEAQPPEGFVPLIRFYVNDKGELCSICKKEMPIDFIIQCVEQWVKDEKSGDIKR